MTRKQQHKDTSLPVAYVNVIFSREIGCARVVVPIGSTVEHTPHYVEARRRYAIDVLIGGDFVGFHCGDRSGNLICFERHADAERLCAVRDEAWRQHWATLLEAPYQDLQELAG